MDSTRTAICSGILLLGAICVDGSNIGYYRVPENDDLTTNYDSICLPRDSTGSLPKCPPASSTGFDRPTCNTNEFRNESPDFCHVDEKHLTQRNPQCPVRLRKPLLCVILGNGAIYFPCLRSIQEGSCNGQFTFMLSGVTRRGVFVLEYGHKILRKDVPNDLKRGHLCQLVRFAAAILFIVLAFTAFLSNITVDKHNPRHEEIQERTFTSRFLKVYRASITLTHQSLSGAYHALVLLMQWCKLGIYQTLVFLIHGLLLGIYHDVAFPIHLLLLGIYHALVLNLHRLSLYVHHAIVLNITCLSLYIYHALVLNITRLSLGIYHCIVLSKQRLQLGMHQIIVLSKRGLIVAGEISIVYILPLLGIYLELQCGCLPRHLRKPTVVVNHEATSEYSFKQSTCNCDTRLPKRSYAVVYAGASSENVYA